MKKIFTIIFILQLIITYGQNCDCGKEFDYLVNKIENDYAGFRDKVNEQNIEKYNKFTNEYREKAKQIKTFVICSMLLDDWLGYFNDKHLSLRYETNIYYTFKNIDKNSTLLRLPSFAWSHNQLIDTLIKNHINEITSKPILIIDLRGNGGGTDYAFQELLPLIYSKPYISKGVEYLASEGNIKYFEKALKKGEIRKGEEEETMALVDSLRANKGGYYQEHKDDTTIIETKYSNPKIVGVIIDDFCASSCEQFVLSAKHSDKTIIFGTRTLGVLDYSNTVPENMLTEGFYIRYPMTRSTRLPENPIDNIGIQPDIEINKPINLNLRDSIDDWVIFVNNYLREHLKLK